MKFAEYRIGVRVRNTPDNNSFVEYSLIELFYDIDYDNPLFDELKEDEEPPMKIDSYTETNALSGWDVLLHLYEEYQDIAEAFGLSLIDLDHFPMEIENGLNIAKVEQVAKEIAEISDKEFDKNIKKVKKMIKKQKIRKTLKKKTVIKHKIKTESNKNNKK